jgi:hypothetical protein
LEVGGWGRGTTCWLTALAVCAILAARPAQAALTEGPRLAAAYDSILNADFDRAAAQLKSACPPAPLEACQVIDVAAAWWRIQIEPDNRTRDTAFLERSAAAAKAAEAWTVREPGRGEAWFYLAGSYAPLVQFDVLRGERLAAARNGSRIKHALEQAIALDPSLADAHFGIGLYEYYADIAPAAAKLLRWLMLLPGGDRVKGLQEMLRARDGGELLKGEADFQLHFIYLWYEHQPERAIALLKSLDARFPSNPIFLERLADAYDGTLHDARASVAALRTLIDRTHSDRVYDAAVTRARAESKLRTITSRAKLF